jgi:hypothetical protein
MSKEKLKTGSFWSITETDSKKEVRVYPEKLNDFVSKELGFYIFKDMYGTFQLVKVEKGSIVQEVQLEELKQAIKYYLRKVVKEEDVWAEFYRSNSINENFKSLMEVLSEIKFNTSTKAKSMFYFRNCIVHLEANKPIKTISYEEFEGFVWKNQIIDRDFSFDKNFQESVFNKFLIKVTGTKEKYFALASILGYLLHPFKDPSYSKAIILLDEKMDFSGEAYGGTGKGLIAEAIKNFTPVVWKDGKNFNHKENFIFDDIRPYHRVIIFDDVKKDFDFEILYSMITGDLTAKRKYKDSKTFTYETSPKVLIISNYMVRGSGGTTDERRRIEFELNPYFNLEHTPLDEFKHILFKDWDEKEWRLFDCLMLRFVAAFLYSGIPKISSETLNLNKLKIETHAEFIEFMNEAIKLDISYDKTILLNEFKSISPANKFISGITFKRWIEKWSLYYNYHSHHFKSNGQSKVIFSLKNKIQIQETESIN